MFSTLTLQAILFFCLCGGVLHVLTRYIPEVRAWYHNRYKWNTDISHEKYQRYDKILCVHLPYYRRLSIAGKARFVHRLIKVMAEKEFFGRNKLVITEEIRVVVCGSIVQVTFGLNTYTLTHFDRILVYPAKFYNSLLELHLKGAASPAGIIMLSWPDVVKGFANESDTYNLALHEMAHALKLDVTEGDDFDLRFSSYLDEWLEIGEMVRRRMKEKKDVKLREYAKTNIHEFFAVCVENFFETPEVMKQNVPNVYNHLCVLLNQDPSKASQDYDLPDDFARNANNKPGIIPVPDRVSVSFEYRMWHWTYTVTGLGLFFMIPLAFYTKDTVVNGFGWKGIYAVSLLTCLAAQASLMYKRDFISIRHLGIYSLFGTAPILMFVFYLVNDTTRIPDQRERYHVVNYTNNTTDRNCLLVLENSALENNESMRTSDMLVTDLREIPLLLVVDYDCGLLGYRVVKSRRLSLETAGIHKKTGKSLSCIQWNF